LDGVAELIANNGVIAPDGEEAQKPRRSMVKRGALLGATLMFISAFLILEGYPVKSQRPMLIITWGALMALIGVSGYVKRLISKIFSEEDLRIRRKSPLLVALHYQRRMARQW
jgi:hypothetical protein